MNLKGIQELKHIYFEKKMSPVLALPRLIELRSEYNKKLLQYVKEEGEGEVKGLVKCVGDHVVDTASKFEVHSSETGNGLVHIRSCYNNKYLVLDEEYNWILAKAEKPEEDRSKRSCTLLRPTSVDGNSKQIRLANVHLETNLCFWGELDSHFAWVLANEKDPDSNSCDLFHVIDWQSLVILPKYVFFKGDNDKFLRALWLEDHSYLQFSATNVEDNPMLVASEILHIYDGKICIRNMHWDKYWRLSPKWIWADAKLNMNEDRLFEPVQCTDDTIALRNVANKLFCRRLSIQKKTNCLNASSETISRQATLKVSEFVISRKIENVNFRLMDARIYDESIAMMVSSSHRNLGSTTQEQTFELSYIDRKTSTWNCSISVKTSTVDTFFMAGIPTIVEGSVEVGSENAYEYMWGETKETEQEISSTYEVQIPPQTKVTVRIMATRGTCDVPFSYTQHDLLCNGETVVTEKDDGVYTGVSNYSYYTEVREESLIKDPKIASAGFKKAAKVSPTGVMTPI